MDSAHTLVAQLYVAMFGRAPDAEGLAYWSASGRSPQEIADAMFGTAAARAYYPTHQSDAQVIFAFYANVLGRVTDLEGLEFWLARFAAPGATRTGVLLEMIDVVTHYDGTDPAGLQSAALFRNRCDAALYYGESGGSISFASDVLANVTSDPASVTTARNATDWLADREVDAYGLQDIYLANIYRNPVVRNVMDGATLTIADGGLMSLVEVHPQDAASAVTFSANLDIQSNWDFTLYVSGFERVNLMLADPPYYTTHEVTIASGHLERLSVSGRDLLHLGTAEHPVDAAVIDASGFVGMVAAYMAPDTRLVGGAGNDKLFAYSGTGAAVEGGAGDDVLYARGPTILVGGEGADHFWLTSYFGRERPSVVADFQPGIDKLDLEYMVRLPDDAWWNGPLDAQTWFPSRLVLPDGSSFGAYLDAAATKAPNYSALQWFEYDGDTYLVIDSSKEATFQDRSDRVVKLVGLVDLGALGYDVEDRMFG
ncbi:DUF4214 domain-containing protein [Ramlibacter sp. PS4R-6]|uniref:DUF4214 domain-containing protein n=1 Tax=Ramlibacter sp. PS4R-6 TaxID=3133438 RepID=UPI003096E9A2